jgi:hypothetical protein
MKKLFLLVGIFLMCVAFVSAAGVSCNIFGYNYTTAANLSSDVYSLNDATYKYINGSDDRAVTSIVEITPRVNITFTQCDNYLNITNSTLLVLVYQNVIGIKNISNTSNQAVVMTTGNYTTNLTAGTAKVVWDTTRWDNSNLTVCYNKTLVKNIDDLVEYTSISNMANDMYTTTGTFGSYNDAIGIKTSFLYGSLNNTNWVVTWQVVDRACADSAGQSSCQNTQRTIYAAFGLIALFSIVLAAFVIIGMFQGGALDGTAIMATVIGIIGLCVIEFVAFIIVNRVGMATCGL